MVVVEAAGRDPSTYCSTAVDLLIKMEYIIKSQKQSVKIIKNLLTSRLDYSRTSS